MTPAVRRLVGSLWGSTFAILVAVACASAPDTSRTTTIIVPDFDTYAQNVDAYLTRRCGSLDCHGQAGRAYRIYSREGFRLPSLTDAGFVSGQEPTHPDEQRANFQALVAVEPEEMSRLMGRQGEDPNVLLFLRKPLMLERHKGGPAMAENDPGYRCVVAWLSIAVVDGTGAPIPVQQVTNPTQPLVPIQPVNPAPSQTNLDPRVTPTMGNTDSTAALAAQLAAQEAANAQALKRQQAQGLIDRIGATENLMKIDLISLTTLDNDDSKFEDFYLQSLRDHGADRGVNGVFEQMTRPGVPEWEADVETCRKAVVAGCGINFFGACTNQFLPGCRSLIPNGDKNNPADKALARAKVAYENALAQSNAEARQKVQSWKRQQALPYEARLAERETQYRSMVAELSRTFGMNYAPTEQAAHARASQTSGVLRIQGF